MFCIIQINAYLWSEQSKIPTIDCKKGFMSRNENTRYLTICLVSEHRLLVCLLVVLPCPRDLTSLVFFLYPVAMESTVRNKRGLVDLMLCSKQLYVELYICT